jgi:hypothetical protein
MATIEEILNAEMPQNVDAGITSLVNEEVDLLKEESGFTRWAGYSAGSSFMGLAQTLEDLGLGIDFDEEEALKYRDLAEVAGEDNPIVSLAGGLVGSVVDVVGGGFAGVALKGLGRITSVLGAQGWNNLVTQGMAGGAVGGFLEPILTQDDSVATNVALGTGLGGVLGGAAYGLQRLLTPAPAPDALIGLPAPTQRAALPAPEQPTALLPSPEVATPRIPFMPDATGKPATAGGVVRLPQDASVLPLARTNQAGETTIPGQQPLGLPLLRPVQHTKNDSIEALSDVRQKLFTIIDEAPSKPAVTKAKVEVKKGNGRIEAWKGQKQTKETVAKIKKEEKRIEPFKETLRAHETVQQAKKELVRIDNGNVSPIILDHVTNVAKSKPKQREQVDAIVREEIGPTPPPNVRLAKEILGRRTTGGDAGAAQVDIGRALVDEAEVNAIPSRSTQAKDAQGFVPGQGGRDFTTAELRRRKMYQNAEDVGRQHFFTPDDLLDKDYNFANAQEAARVLQADVEQAITEGNFKDAGDWIIKTFQGRDTKTLTPVEQLVASRVFAIASDNLNKLMPMFRKLSKEVNGFNGPEAVRLADDLQTTKELMTLMRTLERVDEASRRNISNALKNYKLANKFQKKHQRELMEGKIITDLFFGVTCGK